MNDTLYRVRNAEAQCTPSLLYYKDLITQNMRAAVELAGGAGRLWPHIKTHKMREMISLSQSMGINRFKCATIAELLMVASCKAAHILMAYPLVGPNIGLFLRAVKMFKGSRFYAVGDDPAQLERLSDASLSEGLVIPVLLDVNMGMNRTGVALDRVKALYRRCVALPGIQMEGLHCYDGHCNDADLKKRKEKALSGIETVRGIRAELSAEGCSCDLLVMGGTPSFPIHAAYDDVYLSPGTIFVGDYRYGSDLTDLPMIPAAAVMTRVISHPKEGLFTLDTGSKGISTDMTGRGTLLGVDGAEPILQSEEHWVFRMPEGRPPPAIGEILYVIPMHICTTTALYDSVSVVEGGEVVGCWEVSARGRAVNE